MAVLSPGRIRLRTFAGRALPARTVHVDWDANDAEKDGYPHFMLKEIHEQPRAIGMTMAPLIDPSREDGLRPGACLDATTLARARRLLLVGCGPSWHAALAEAPRLVRAALDTDECVEGIARLIYESTSCLYLGRGINVPLALEGALKLKEISYIHAEGYAAGEMKHGPIALIDGTLPVVVLAPRDDLYDKMVGCIEEVKVRYWVVISLEMEGEDAIWK